MPGELKVDKYIQKKASEINFTYENNLTTKKNNAFGDSFECQNIKN